MSSWNPAVVITTDTCLTLAVLSLKYLLLCLGVYTADDNPSIKPVLNPPSCPKWLLASCGSWYSINYLNCIYLVRGR